MCSYEVIQFEWILFYLSVSTHWPFYGYRKILYGIKCFGYVIKNNLYVHGALERLTLTLFNVFVGAYFSHCFWVGRFFFQYNERGCYFVGCGLNLSMFLDSFENITSILWCVARK